MKPRLLIWGSILAIVLLAVMFRHRPAPPHADSAPEAVPPASQPATTNNVARPATPYLPHITASPVQATPPDSNDTAVARVVKGFVDSKNAPINFYAQFIDQHSNPVPGVKITVDIEQVTSSNPALMEFGSKDILLDRTADGEGRFDVLEQAGSGIGVESIQKDGYETPPNSFYHFGPGNGSYNAPVLIKLWKKGEPAQLVTGGKFWAIIPDGRVYTIDLLQGTKSESPGAAGDFRISVNRPAGVSRRDHYDWSFQITPVDGGILQMDDDFTYEAPEKGYAPEFDFHLAASDPRWTYHPKMNFYLTSRSGQVYGRMTMEVFAHYQDGGVLKFDYAVNPNGSRNLQP